MELVATMEDPVQAPGQKTSAAATPFRGRERQGAY